MVVASLPAMPSRFVAVNVADVRWMLMGPQDKEKPMAVRTGNIMAARGKLSLSLCLGCWLIEL